MIVLHHATATLKYNIVTFPTAVHMKADSRSFGKINCMAAEAPPGEYIIIKCL